MHSNEQMTFLLVEDNPDHAELIREAFDDTYGSSLTLIEVETLSAIDQQLTEHPIDLLICDLSLPDSGIDNTVEALKTISRTTPVIVLTSLDDMELAKVLVAAGVQDYLPKNDLNPNLLWRICSYAIERKKLDILLEQRNADYQAFCYSLSHDFKGALRRIAGFSELLNSDPTFTGNLSAEQREFLDQIDANARRIRHITDDLYRYLALESSPVDHGEVDLNQLIEDSLRELAAAVEQSQASIRVEALPTVRGNASQLQIVLQNLLGNAIRYAREAPAVRLFVAAEKPNQVTVGIEDNGIGIAKDKHESIFSPFYRVSRHKDNPGSGLGLSIVKRIIDKHRGSIRLDSEEGIGTTFYITLPRA